MTPEEIAKNILIGRNLASGKGKYYPNSNIFPSEAVILAKGYQELLEKNAKLKDLLRDIQPSLKYEIVHAEAQDENK